MLQCYTALGLLVLTGGLSASTLQRRADPAPRSGVNLTAQRQAEFQKRVEEYAALHKKIEDSLPKLSKEATPQEVDQDQRTMERLIVQARPDAKPGDVFTPAMIAFVKSLLAEVFKGPQGARARAAIFDEPHPVTPVINKRYPDDVPLSTMPPRVLQTLPKLPEELEYRFVSDHLILMDVHAHIIVDYILNAMPPPPASSKPAAK
jgi:hypothetical protein